MLMMEIKFKTGRVKGFQKRTFVFKTEDKISLDYFISRGTINRYSFPKYLEGTVEDYYIESAVTVRKWKDFCEFDQLRSPNIFSIFVNNKNIDEPIIEAAKKVGAEVKFPLLYHVQFFFKDIPDWVFNWYPTTGTLSRQKTTENFYRTNNLGVFIKVEDALSACLIKK